MRSKLALSFASFPAAITFSFIPGRYNLALNRCAEAGRHAMFGEPRWPVATTKKNFQAVLGCCRCAGNHAGLRFKL